MKNARRSTFIAAAALAAALSASCGARMYPGPARQASEIAVLATDHATTQIMTLDGARNGSYLKRRFEVLPGAHKLGVAYESSVAVSGSRLLLEASVDAGKTYTVRMTQEGAEIRFEVVDDATGAVVSKIVGDEPNE